MEKRRQSRPLNGLNQLTPDQWSEYWQLKQRNDADARKDFWRSLFIALGIAIPVLIYFCM